jgi:hypothetical protein
MTRVTINDTKDRTLISPEYRAFEECSGKRGFYMAARHPKINKLLISAATFFSDAFAVTIP